MDPEHARLWKQFPRYSQVFIVGKAWEEAYTTCGSLATVVDIHPFGVEWHIQVEADDGLLHCYRAKHCRPAHAALSAIGCF